MTAATMTWVAPRLQSPAPRERGWAAREWTQLAADGLSQEEAVAGKVTALDARGMFLYLEKAEAVIQGRKWII